MSSSNVLDPMAILRVSVMVIVGFWALRTVANMAGLQSIARVIPS